MKKTKSEKSFTSLSVEQQKSIRGWGGTKPPRVKMMGVPNKKQK